MADNEQRGMQRRSETGMQRGGGTGGQLRTYGDPDWHRGTDMYGNPVWYRSYGWSYRSGGDTDMGEGGGRQAEAEPHMHGRTESRHYQRSDDRIREDVYDRINDHPNLDSGDIRVSVSKGEVTLEGSVHDKREKRLAEDVAESVSGVKDVQNRLRPQEQQATQGQGAGTSGAAQNGAHRGDGASQNQPPATASASSGRSGQ